MRELCVGRGAVVAAAIAAFENKQSASKQSDEEDVLKFGDDQNTDGDLEEQTMDSSPFALDRKSPFPKSCEVATILINKLNPPKKLGGGLQKVKAVTDAHRQKLAPVNHQKVTVDSHHQKAPGDTTEGQKVACSEVSVLQQKVRVGCSEGAALHQKVGESVIQQKLREVGVGNTDRIHQQEVKVSNSEIVARQKIGVDNSEGGKSGLENDQKMKDSNKEMDRVAINEREFLHQKLIAGRDVDLQKLKMRMNDQKLSVAAYVNGVQKAMGGGNVDLQKVETSHNQKLMDQGDQMNKGVVINDELKTMGVHHQNEQMVHLQKAKVSGSVDHLKLLKVSDDPGDKKVNGELPGIYLQKFVENSLQKFEDPSTEAVHLRKSPLASKNSGNARLQLGAELEGRRTAEQMRPSRKNDDNAESHSCNDQTGEEDTMSPAKNSRHHGPGDRSQCGVDKEERDTCGFESAVKDFDMTAEDVQKFVAESMRNIANDRKKADLPSDETDSSDEGATSETDSDECVIREGLATIAEEVTASSVHSSDDEEEDGEVDDEDDVEDGSTDASSSPDEDGTVKVTAEKWCNGSGRTGSSSDMSSTSSERPRHIKDSSTRCNGDFQWICKDPVKEKKQEESIPLTKPPINRRERTPRRSVEKTPPGSLDRRRHHTQNRQERDQKSRSSHVLKSPPRLEDFIGTGCKNWCCNPHPPEYYFDFHRRHERMDPQRYGSNPMLMDRFLERGSHPDLYGDRIRHEGVGCSCAYHVPPPPCYFYGGDGRGYHWTPTKAPDQDERARKLQAERDNLQLQVQVLTEQIEAQGDKIGDLEKNLGEKKQQLIGSEDLLQREMLSRSSLETQKLELMTTISELKLQHASLERENLELRNMAQINNNSIDGIKKPPFIPRASPQSTLTSTPVHGSNQTLRKSPSPSPINVNSAGTSPRRTDAAVQELHSPKTPPSNYRRQIELQYASLPRQQFLSNGGTTLSVVDSNANPANGVRKGVAFADTEKIVIEDQNSESPQSPQSLQGNKNKGIKKIFGKIKRSGSGNLEDFTGCGEFQRGGVRATASARLGWSDPIPTIKPDKPFIDWDTENICDWLQDLGLDQYVPDAKKWVKSGQQLLEASMTEIEKELVIKNPLHRKKLQLALIDAEANSSSDPFLPKAGKLDTAWVLRWLDDTGLPQYKETFLLNRIDGRVLHRLTMDDLALLHVTSMLHVASIKRGIQVLRDNNYDAGCLQRRSLPDDPEQPTPKQVSLWTTHRVMEWLRAVDLAEYAPNLRGAGVHGGLLVHENKFTAELLAALLSIPPGKTLLRRHLNTHFNELLGKDIIQAKREAESTLGYIPLTLASKLKVAKKSHFSLKRNKSKSEADYGDLVCPLNQNSGENCQNGSTFNNSMGMMKMSVREEGAYLLAEEDSFSSSSTNSPLPERRLQ